MPIYEYRCTNGHRFEVMQKIADDRSTAARCAARPATRVLHPVAIHFKGSGFYSTDYGRGKKAALGAASPRASSDSKSSDSKSSDSSVRGGGSEPKKAAEG